VAQHAHPHAVVDGAQPVRSLLRLLGRRPGRMALAIGAFALKDSPLWFLPVVTAKIIDVVARRGPIDSVLVWFAIAVVLLVQNYPNHLAYTRNLMVVVRDTGARLRNALAARLQSLSIGFHTRASASVVQTKVVRDVESIELMLQQIAHPLLSAGMVLFGAIGTTAVMVPQFLPVYALTVPLALLLRYVLAHRSREPNELFRRKMEGFAARVGEMASLIPVTRAHGLERTAVTRVAHGAESLRRAGLRLDMLNGRLASISWVTMQLLGVGCLVLAAVASLSGAPAGHAG
jgi:ATP-binding cassette, subfamily B, bacterial